MSSREGGPTYTRAVRRGVLFVYGRPASFIDVDRDLLAERWPVREWRERRPLVNVPRLTRAVWRSDVVFAWFAAWHAFWPITLAWLLRRPSVLVIGGFDVASLPDIGYGQQRGGPRRLLSRWIVARASRLVTNSYFSREEIGRNLGVPPERITVVHHGLEDRFGALPDGEREPLAVTVGVVDRMNLERKGHRLFVEAAVLAPEVRFVLVGRADDEAAERLRARAPANVELAGFVPDEELDDLLGRAAAYVQPSRHEGFGMSVAEAMLAGCIPVVTPAGALPEVVGDAGVVIEGHEPGAVAAGVRQALASGPDERRHARERVLEAFPLEVRRQGLWRVVEEALAGRGPKA